MNRMAAFIVTAATAGMVGLAPASLFAQASSGKLPASESPLTPEKNPPGDIPDDQVFIEYRSPLGFSIKVPEGWARREATGGVTFNDKYNTVEVTVEARVEPVTVNSVKNEQLAELRKNDKAAIQ